MTTKIKSISITGIRGIKDSISLPLNEKSVLLYGDNGTGKSSISDAIEWFYTDKVSHLSGGEIDLKDALRNSYQKDTDTVSIAISYNKNVIGATKSLFRKRGKLTFELPNTGTWSNCSLCSDAEVYRLSILEIIDRNEMGFEPFNAGDGCSDVWRVSKASCWAQWTRLIMNPVTAEVRTIELNKPCNSNCCLRRMRVCYNEDRTKTVTDLGTSGNSPICDSLTYQTTYPPIENINCVYTCDMLDEIDDVVSKSAYLENVEAVEYTKINPNEIVFEYNLNQSSNRIDVNISETNVEKLNIKLYDINGKPVKQAISNSISSNSFITLDISELVTGTYFISFELNGLEFKSDKFIVVK